MHWIATLGSTSEELGGFDHGVEIEAPDCFDALSAAMLIAGPAWTVLSVHRIMSAAEQRGH